MCGRYYRQTDKQRIAETFRLGQLPDDFVLPPDYNIAPTTFQPVIRQSRDTDERDPANGEWLQTFSIITTEPNELTVEVHNRMLVILHERD